MSASFSWGILLILSLYTLIILGLSARSRKKNHEDEAFIDGGRSLSFFMTVMMTAVLWGSAVFVLELNTGFLHGLSAIWFGVSVSLSGFLLVVLTMRFFRRHAHLTLSELIGNTFGQHAKRTAAFILAVTLPILAMSNVYAATSFLHAVLHVPFGVLLLVTTLVTALYVMQSGIWSIAYTQIVNGILLLAAGVVLVFVLLPNHAVIGHPITLQGYHSLWGLGASSIGLWLVSGVANAFSGQAEMQVMLFARSDRAAKRALLVSAILVLLFSFFPVWAGMQLRAMMPHTSQAFTALATVFIEKANPVEVTIFSLAIWSMALTYSAQHIFSGASSLASDLPLLFSFRGKHFSLKQRMRIAIFVEAFFVAIPSLLQPVHLVWWSVLASLLRFVGVGLPVIFVWVLVGKKHVKRLHHKQTQTLCNES